MSVTSITISDQNHTDLTTLLNFCLFTAGFAGNEPVFPTSAYLHPLARA
jgi:hypothetical protein